MAVNPDDEDEDDGEEWRFSLEDIERREREKAGTDETASDDEDEESGGNIAGSFGPAEEIEPGDIDIENALFVVVGVVLAVLAIVGFMGILP